MTYEIKPPVEIYLNGTQISDAEGHLCTGEGPAEAEAIVAALNDVVRLRAALQSIVDEITPNYGGTLGAIRKCASAALTSAIRGKND